MVEVAYDLSGFVAKTEEQHDEELKTRSLHLIKSRRQEKTVAPLKIIIGAVITIMIASVMIYSQAVLTEITAETNSYESKIQALMNEHTRLEGELEASTSIKAIEESAENRLGLSKIDSSQIEYVNLTDTDKVTVTKTGGKYVVKEMWNDITEFLSEYLPF